MICYEAIGIGEIAIFKVFTVPKEAGLSSNMSDTPPPGTHVRVKDREKRLLQKKGNANPKVEKWVWEDK